MTVLRNLSGVLLYISFESFFQWLLDAHNKILILLKENLAIYKNLSWDSSKIEPALELEPTMVGSIFFEADKIRVDPRACF